MTREEVRNRLYAVADAIRANADKYAKGEVLENEDWVRAANDFNVCMNYLMNSHSDFEEVRKFLEKSDNDKICDKLIVNKPDPNQVLAFEHVHNCRHFCPENVLADFLSRPASERVVTLGFPKPVDPLIPNSPEELLHKAGVGTIDTIVDNGDEAIATLTLDPKLPDSKRLLDLIRGGIRLGFAYGGVGECLPDDENTYQFTEISSVAILPDSPKENADEVIEVHKDATANADA